MRKRILTLLLPLVLLLAACAGKTPTPAAMATTQPTNTPKSPEAVATATRAPAGCSVTSPLPTPGPTEASLFPARTDYDFSQGSEDAAVTIVEYSDFQ